MPARHTLLVVDDEPDVVSSVNDLLRLDYRVLGATRAQDAIELLRREEVHLIMTDQRMPGMSGVEFLSQVRGEHPEAIRLLFTGYADIRAVIDAINQGNVYRYITKPWDPDELVSVIREAADRYDLLVERRRLLNTLQEQNQNLERANAELKRANELKQSFIQVASHELRTPLTILLALTDLSMDETTEDNPARPWLLRIDQAVQRLNHLVNQIVTMLIAGQFETTADRKLVDMVALLSEAADDVRPFIALRRQNLILDVPADLGIAHVEAGKIRDCVNHLLLNAIKFTPDKGDIWLAARAVDNNIEISVKDSGPGIEPKCLSQIFEPFFTGFDVSHHSSGRFEYGRKGLGLGLSVVKSFAQMHGGTVQVSSEPGHGAAFVISLPR